MRLTRLFTPTRSISPLDAINDGAVNNGWAKVRFAIQHAYMNELEKFEYFMRTDDDSFVIVENLHYLLSHMKSEEPIIIGREVTVRINN